MVYLRVDVKSTYALHYNLHMVIYKHSQAMPNRLQISIKILKNATLELLSKISKAKKDKQAIVNEINRKKDEENINNIRKNLGI